MVVERFEIPDLNTAYEIRRALDRRDDDMLWEVARRASSQQVFYEQLRSQVLTLSYTGRIAKSTARMKAGRSDMQCAVLMVPVVVGGSARELVSDAEVLAPVVGHIRSWLEEWFEYKQVVTMFSSLIDYAEVCQWTPSITRSKAQRLVNSGVAGEVTPEPHDFHLPVDAARLAFFTAIVQRPMEAPTLPPLDAEGDRVLCAKIEGAIQLCNGARGLSPVRVLTPAFASEAIESGMDAWLTSLVEHHGIRRWDVQQADQDVVLLQLEIGEEQPFAALVPLRAHQLGLDGVEKCIARVAGLGTSCFTKPQ